MALHWPHHPSDPVPLPSVPSSVLGQRCRDLLLQLYLQRPEVRVPVPEVLLQSEGATSSSICKVRGTARWSPVAHGTGGWALTSRELSPAVISSSPCSLVQRDAPPPSVLRLWTGRSWHMCYATCGQYGAMASIRRVMPVTPEYPRVLLPPTHSGQLPCASAGWVSLCLLELCEGPHELLRLV